MNEIDRAFAEIAQIIGQARENTNAWEQKVSPLATQFV